MKAPRLLLALGCAVLIAGCGGGAATGSGVDTKAKGGPGNLFASSAPPTKKAATPTKVTTKAAAPKPVVPKAAPVAPKPQAPQKAPEAPPFRVTINGDKSGKPLFDPPQVAVYSGTKIIWTNGDTKPHGVQAQNGAFSSGSIPAGGSYTWIAGAAGMYAYQDSSRPYVNAQIQVSAR